MKNILLTLLIFSFLSSCASSGTKKTDQKVDNKSCQNRSENNQDIEIIHRGFLERINPINSFFPIFDGIFTDIANMKAEINKNDSTNECKNVEK